MLSFNLNYAALREPLTFLCFYKRTFDKCGSVRKFLTVYIRRHN